ncbi:MAG: cation diffusion facilitator family transporter [Caldisericia bacterium]
MDEQNQLIEKKAIVSGLIINIVLFFFKLIAGVLGGSAALVADSVHTVTDVTTDVAVLIGSKFWHSPADKNHTYGHGRIETAVAFGIGLILAFTSLQLIISASTNLISGSHTHTEFWTIWIAGLSICFKEAIFFYTLHASKITKSMALKANAWHHRADSISTIPVIIAIYLTSIYPGLWWVDPVGVLLVAGLI